MITLMLVLTLKAQAADLDMPSATHSAKLELPSSSTVMDCGKPDPRETKKDGTYTCTNYYKHDVPNAKFTLKNGKLEGKALGYRENGEPEFEGTYKNGLKDGEIKTRWSKKANRFDTVSHYKAGKKDGVEKEIVDDENNNFSVRQFKDDQRVGYTYVFHQGKIIAAEDCEGGDKTKCDSQVIPGYESAWTELKNQDKAKADKEKSDANREVVKKNREGVVIERYTLKDGRVTGKYEEFYDNGKLRLQSDQVASKKNNETEYFEDGQLKRKSVYDNTGRFETNHEEYYQNGKPKLTWTRKKVGNWDTTETFKEFHDNGKVSSEGIRNGKLAGYGSSYEGPIKFYDEQGKLIALENYKDGKKDGVQKSMSVDENKKPIIVEELYAKGVLQKVTTIDATSKKTTRAVEYFPDGSTKSDKKF